MRVTIVISALCVLLALAADIDTSNLVPVPMHSFRPPYSTGRMGIRWWNYGGSVSVFQDHLRLTPDVGSQAGYIWNKNPLSIKDWEATLSVRIDGKGRLGGDGIAFWYVAEPNLEGKAFGSRETWKGLGVFIDTFDNDNKHDNPYVSVIVNDGSKIYDPTSDGKEIQIGGCRAAFRKTAAAAFLRVRYQGSIQRLEVSYDVNSNGKWQECYSGTVDLPTGYYLGISAATGGVSDNQDVHYFELRRLDMNEGQPTPSQGASLGTKDPEEEAQNAKAAKEMEDLKKELEELKKMNAETKPAEPTVKATDLPAGSFEARIAVVEEQIKQMETKLSSITKVAGGIETISTSVEQLKQRIEKNKPSGSCDMSQLKSEMARQQQELNRIVSRAQDSFTSPVLERIMALEQSTQGLRTRVNDMAEKAKKTGSGGFTNVFMIPYGY